jgi:uncharacterized protein involved in exopolysaccharide biosynthesis
MPFGDTPLGGLAALAGVSVGDASSIEPLAVMRSRALAREFIEARNLIPVLFSDKWDSQTGTWKVRDAAKAPDIRDAEEYFRRKILSVEEERRTGLVHVTVEWKHPEAAAEWATGFVEMANERMRQSAIIEANRNMSYLQSELDRAQVVVLQQSIGRLLESEMQKLMLARGNEEFAFRVIDRAQVPKRPIRPRAVPVVIVATLFGALATALGFVLASVTRKEIRR